MPPPLQTLAQTNPSTPNQQPKLGFLHQKTIDSHTPKLIAYTMSTPVNTSPRKPSRTSLKILCAVCKKQVTTPLFLPGSKLREQWSSLEDGEQTNIGDEDLGDDDVEMLSPEELRVLWWDDSSDDEEEEEGGEVTEESEDDDAEEKGEGNDKEEKEEADNDDEVKGHGGNEYFSSAEEMEWEAFPDLKGIYEEEERKVEVMVHDQYGVVFVEGKNEWLKERIEDQKK